MTRQIAVQQGQELRKIRGDCRIECQRIATHRMDEGQMGRVQRLPTKCSQALRHQRIRATRHYEAFSINRVPDEGIARVREMDTNLMSTPGGQLHTHVRMRAKALHDTVMGNRFATVTPHRHTEAVDFVTTDRRIHRTAANHDADADSFVFASDLPRGQLLHQPFIRARGSRHHHQAAGVFVEPMNDASPRQIRQARVVVEQCVHEGPGGVARPRVHYQPSRLVQHQHVRVLVAYFQRQVLWQRIDAGGRFRHNHHGLSTDDEILGPRHSAIDRDAPGVQPTAQTGTGVVRIGLGERLVHSPPGQGVVETQLQGGLAALGEIVIGRHRRQGHGNTGEQQEKNGLSLEPKVEFGERSQWPVEPERAQAITESILCHLLRSRRFAVTPQARFSRRLIRTALLVAAVSLLSACSFFGKDKKALILSDPDQGYVKAYDELMSGNIAGAVRTYEALEASFPFTDAARQARLDLMYAYYRAGATEQAIDAADTFIRENPTHPRLDYAYYIKGLVWFERTPNILERWMDVDLSARPPKDARQSFQAFGTVVTQYPRSDYAHDARRRMVYLRNRLAEYEMNVARYYFARGAEVAALNRARYVVETYDGSPSVRSALVLMAACYDRLKLPEQATTARQVYTANYNEPTPNWEAVSKQRSWYQFWKQR